MRGPAGHRRHLAGPWAWMEYAKLWMSMRLGNARYSA